VRTYAVTWLDAQGRLHAGKLELGPEALELAGNSSRRTIRYDELLEARVGRGSEERVRGRPALVLQGKAGETLYVSSVSGAGEVVEIAELLGRRRQDGRPRA